MNCLLFGIALKPLKKLSFCKKNTEVVKIQLVRLINVNYHVRGDDHKKYSTIKILLFLSRVRAGNCDSSKGMAYFLISAHYCPSVYVFVRLSFTNT